LSRTHPPPICPISPSCCTRRLKFSREAELAEHGDFPRHPRRGPPLPGYEPALVYTGTPLGEIFVLDALARRLRPVNPMAVL
jgi:hypothetical protein